ncbi:hypothetical protein TCAL_04859 [Tigriopus californicus]|uniref:Uncharacterized protein n=1 Tax=Tigriopus californicus TaxID=6832 RepID=A0A553PT44_TIGCA|nr:myotrophin-like [Tigriopus californicus]TRY80850.1 hypothetical protein TCAL_04859 [Tigriopus californicus]
MPYSPKMATGILKWEDSLATNILLIDIHKKTIKKILDNPDVKRDLGKDSWKDTPAPLHLASAAGNVEIMAVLISAGANVNSYAVGIGAWLTPLHHAAFQGHVDGVKLLLKCGADHTLEGFQDALKGTALEFAKKKENKAIVDLLEAARRFPPKKVDPNDLDLRRLSIQL